MKIVVLISGSGTNLQAIIDANLNNITIAAVISNEPNAYGLERARNASIPTHIVNHRDFASRDTFDEMLRQQIDAYQPDLIVLSGFMRRLGSDFVNHYRGKIINIHPSLLPKYPGLHTHRKALKNGDKEHGTSIHFVTSELDAGPLIAQEKLKIHPHDTEDSLKSRIQALEHQLYPTVLKLFSEDRITLKDNVVIKK